MLAQDRERRLEAVRDKQDRGDRRQHARIPGAAPAHVTGNPTSCEGFSEKRVYLEAQSWWEPQAGPTSHPGTGKQGHIHIETCFPLHQTFGATGTIALDIKVRLHNMPGVMRDLIVDAYGDYSHLALQNINWRCPQTDCVRDFHVDVPLDKMRYSGPHIVLIKAYMRNEDGNFQVTVPRWGINLINGKPLPPLGSTAQRQPHLLYNLVSGDSLYPAANAGGSYARVSVRIEDFPWDPVTGRHRPKSGLWELPVFYDEDQGFAYLDANLHAQGGPDKGTVLYEGKGYLGESDLFHPVRIDTTKLTAGEHKLLLGTCNTKPSTGDHCGTQVIRFRANSPSSTPCQGLSGTRLKRCQADEKLKAALARCKKLKGKKARACVKRAKALARCDKLKAKKKAACRKKATRIR